ncbi:MAG TPA: peptidoglycan bridge formation glycyltransferase FemA/FemB family protein [bacterium]|nr:peptidoglycan bridge formation glycyltransferase FemA/FemB family protein [bacterium]HPW39832.1 peptidoglycan bridge formation glycyltransferase FemA/FemB family protein [bacterium]
MKAIFYQEQSVEKWDEFIRNNSVDFGLLQSSSWAKFQRLLGREVFLLAATDEEENILAAALIIEQPLKFGFNYFYLPRGPILVDAATDQLSLLELLWGEIGRLAQTRRAVFLRFDPAWQDNEAVQLLLSGLVERPVGQVQPRQTLILALDQSETELLAAMKPKTRYNIKIAQKHKVTIDWGGDYFEDFWRLTEKTSQRQQIVSHPKEYYRKMVAALGEQIQIMVALVDRQVVAANLVVFFGDWCVYLHGASDYVYREKMAPFLLQWTTIVEAKKKGKKYYDFWGVDEDKWPGVSRFKKGFAPNTAFTAYAGAWDKIYRPLWYNIYQLAIRKR